jgi:hypothetical protein
MQLLREQRKNSAFPDCRCESVFLESGHFSKDPPRSNWTHLVRYHGLTET